MLYSIRELFHSPSAYALLKVDYDEDQIYKTEVVKGTDEPRWNEHFDV